MRRQDDIGVLATVMKRPLENIAKRLQNPGRRRIPYWLSGLLVRFGSQKLSRKWSIADFSCDADCCRGRIYAL
jgi:hypothetical protein